MTRLPSATLDEPDICGNDGVQECHSAPIRRWHCPAVDVTQRLESAIQRHVQQSIAHACIHGDEPTLDVSGPYETSQIGHVRGYCGTGRCEKIDFAKISSEPKCMRKVQRSLIRHPGAIFSRPKSLHVSKSIFSHLPDEITPIKNPAVHKAHRSYLTESFRRSTTCRTRTSPDRLSASPLT
jgi:hypothetical protein